MAVGYGGGMSRLAAVLERLVHAVEAATVLDRPADLAQKVTGTLGPGPVKDVLSGTPIGHPLHPALVVVPTGAFASAAVLDVTGDARGARRLVGFGLLSSLPAAAAGLSDWHDTQGAERRVGVAHALLNTAALGLLGASWVARGRGDGGRLLSTAGLALLGGSSWLGGHLAYAQGVGVDTTAFAKPPVDWTDAGPVADLADGAAHAVTVEDVPVLLLSRGDRVLALANRCTHRGAPLTDGPLVGDCVECPWHGSRFSLETGEVERGPATRPQPVFRTRVVDGRVQVRRDEERSLRLNPTS